MIAKESMNAWFLGAFLLIANLPGVAAADSIALEAVATGLNNPLLVTHAGDDSNRLFIVEQAGRVMILSDDGLLEQPFLDISSEISSGGERGLLGLAFHPEYDRNGLFFVNFTDRNGDSVVARFSVSGNPNRADPNSEREVLAFSQPFPNHNGGHLAFGPDGYLYIASGDGGSGGDPGNNAQDLGNLLGKMLRIDVDGPRLAIPPDNPFVGMRGAREEIWAMVCATPGASVSIARPETCSSAMWASEWRRKSTSRTQPVPEERTTGGDARRVHFVSSPPAPVTTRLSPTL